MNISGETWGRRLGGLGGLYPYCYTCVLQVQASTPTCYKSAPCLLKKIGKNFSMLHAQIITCFKASHTSPLITFSFHCLCCMNNTWSISSQKGRLRCHKRSPMHYAGHIMRHPWTTDQSEHKWCTTTDQSEHSKVLLILTDQNTVINYYWPIRTQ